MNHGWHVGFHRSDMLMRSVEVWIYRHSQHGDEVLRPDGSIDTVDPGVDAGGEPAFRLRADHFDALIDAAYEERVRRGTAPDTEAKVLREILAKEQARVDHALNMETGP